MGDIVQYLESVLGPSDREGSGLNLRFLCPVCKDPGRKFFFHISKRVGQCFHCKYRPSLQRLIEDSGQEFQEVIRAVSLEEFSEELESMYPVYSFPELTLPSDAEPIQKHEKAMEYLLGRGVSEEEIQTHGVKYCPYGFYAFRIIFPCYLNGINRGFVARTISSFADPPYLNHPDMQKSKLLWNLDSARESKEIIVTEGVFDALSVGYNAVATFGKDLSAPQRTALLRTGVKSVVLLWDSDAREDIEKTASMLRPYTKTRVVFLESGDPGSLKRDYLQQRVAAAQVWSSEDSFAYKLRREAKRAWH